MYYNLTLCLSVSLPAFVSCQDLNDVLGRYVCNVYGRVVSNNVIKGQSLLTQHPAVQIRLGLVALR